MREELVISTNNPILITEKLDALEVEMHPRLINFPRSERYFLVKEFQDAFYRIRMDAINAMIGKNKKISLNSIDAQVEYIRQLISKAVKLNLMKPKAGAYVTTEFVDPIGKIIGSWKMKLKAKKSKSAEVTPPSPQVPLESIGGELIVDFSKPF